MTTIPTKSEAVDTFIDKWCDGYVDLALTIHKSAPAVVRAIQNLAFREGVFLTGLEIEEGLLRRLGTLNESE